MVEKQVKRIFVEKKPGFDIEAQGIYHDLSTHLGIAGLTGVSVVHRYDIAGITEEQYQKARGTIFSEPPVDNAYDAVYPLETDADTQQKLRIVAIEYLPGQYDQRADSAEQCLQILTLVDRPVVKTAKIILLQGALSSEDDARIKQYLINPIECREAKLEKPESLESSMSIPPDVENVVDFIHFSAASMAAFHRERGFAMSIEDLQHCQNYFREEEKRNPTITELKVLDTYWSDHCRHTTFLSNIDAVDIQKGKWTQAIQKAYENYLETRQKLYAENPKNLCLMDVATIGMKALKQAGKIPDLDVSDEINACSVKLEVDVDGKTEPWLIMFKNETHNHPTEIEPFGGAATCLGGAIRDPLSGRSYVYQAMRVTGSGNPLQKIEASIPGKLAQRKITTGAAAGYSSYGNQIGLATGLVREIYHAGYVAKRMEIGAVIGAAPATNVRREKPQAGDVIILLGGRTGRDGCGGATGSSKEHTEDSLASCSAEVQKGNPPTERKIQRLFRNPAVSRLIKKCNDFGAGGVSVAIGELADGLVIHLDKILKKYDGLDGTELAISESQERMAVVVDTGDVDSFVDKAAEENLEAVPVATVTEVPRLKMFWRGQAIVDVSRAFLDTNGVTQHAKVAITAPAEKGYFDAFAAQEHQPVTQELWEKVLTDLNVCSQKGLVERFDSSIGAGTVLMPFGGRYQLSPEDAMVAKIPLLAGETNTGTVMTFGFDPDMAMWSPFHAAAYAVIEAVSKNVAAGADYRRIRLSLQEYFEKLGKDATKWGKPFSALLGALWVQQALEIPAIGGKDSMSGTFKDLHVPPTLVAFAMSPIDVRNTLSATFQRPGNRVFLVEAVMEDSGLPDIEGLKALFQRVFDLTVQGKIHSAKALGRGGLIEAVSKMSFGNRIGLAFEENDKENWDAYTLKKPAYGSILLEVSEEATGAELFPGMPVRYVGRTIENQIHMRNLSMNISALCASWSKPLESVFPLHAKEPNVAVTGYAYAGKVIPRSGSTFAKPRVLIPVFPGTNCEIDTAKGFEKAGAQVALHIFNNLTAQSIQTSVRAFAEKVREAQIIAIPGGFSGGDEPDGSGKFIATAFRNPYIKEAITDLLKHRDGLMLGICNGFQALIKLGLVPFGEIREMDAVTPTLTFNEIGRHISCMVHTKVVSNLSPWLSHCEVGEVHSLPVSHGEGRFVVEPKLLETLMQQGQIATQYVDLAGNPTGDIFFNPNGSVMAIEGISSPCGRVFGKMAHSERVGNFVSKNVPGKKDQQLFTAGVNYFK